MGVTEPERALTRPRGILHDAADVIVPDHRKGQVIN